MFEETKYDPEMHAMTKEEISTCSEQVKEYEKNLILKLLPKDEADESDALIEIRAGITINYRKLFWIQQICNIC